MLYLHIIPKHISDMSLTHQPLLGSAFMNYTRQNDPFSQKHEDVSSYTGTWPQSLADIKAQGDHIQHHSQPAVRGKAGQGRAGKGKAGQGRAGQGRARQGKAENHNVAPYAMKHVRRCSFHCTGHVACGEHVVSTSHMQAGHAALPAYT